MRIEYYNQSGGLVYVELVEVEDHWDACTYAFDKLHTDDLAEAEDFQVYDD